MRRGGQQSWRVMATALVAGALALVLVSFFARPSAAQEVRVDVAPGPHYQGDPIVLQIMATQFEEEPAPEIEFDPQPGLSLRFLGVSPSTSTSITIVNGRLSRVHEVSFAYRYELTSLKVGPVRVPEFRVRQGTTVRSTEPFLLQIAAVPTSDEVGIAVVLPEGPIFVGQKVPVAIELRLDQAVLQDFLGARVQIPLFDAPGLRFIDASMAGATAELEVVTANGVMRLPATSEERVVGGRASLVLRAERTLVAQRPGRIEVEAPTVSVERGTRFRQDLWGQRRAVATERTVSAGRRVDLEIAELPTQGRPASFAGAVGSDFSLEVTADRSVVALGEPIELSFHLRGHGDLSSAGLPPLDAEGLLDPARFRLPPDPPAGLLDEDGKHFAVTLRVLDASVREIPALAYSYFDARSRRFETVRSQPIALSVGAARVVGAEAVTSGADDALASAADPSAAREAQAAPGESGAAASPPGGEGEAGARLSSLAETSANLAIERDPALLLGAARVRSRQALTIFSLYGVGLAFLGLGVLDRRRRALDPGLRARLASLARARQAIEAAASPANAEGAGALGRALRELVAAVPEEASPALDALLAECDELRFAPAAGTAGERAGGVPVVLAERARRLIEERQAALASAASRAGTATDAGRDGGRRRGPR